jgi:DNA-binding MarR family transcriptional regulator
MVKQSGDESSFEEFAASVFRLIRSLRSTAGLWTQLPGELRRSDVTLLRVLDEHGECRPGFIADRLGIGPSMVSRQLAVLVEAGIVVRRRDPEDGRAELVDLTDSGRSRLDAMKAAYVTGMQTQFADWDDAKVHAAAVLLDEISDQIAPALGRECARTPLHPKGDA